ncbi:hypothetical protein BaRGS_00027658 [Batillaria attramentaria]|uniref:Uncharacterized protein n=1 Tax=Batillaria attramentaria TaxID=370345 RepID=A0ABD0K2C8_9CAEN
MPQATFVNKFLGTVVISYVHDTDRHNYDYQVLLFTHDTPKAVVAYSPPDSESFYPTDVCFYVIGGVTVLLVADWLGDSVHVLHVTEERLSFVRHLAADCTELVKPGALSTDWTGRLWVGCRGGTVLCGSPLGPD